MEEKRFNYILNEWEKQDKKLNRTFNGTQSRLPSKVEATRKQLKDFYNKIKKNAGGILDFTDWRQRFQFSKDFDIPYTGTYKFLTAIEEIEKEKPNLTLKEQKSFFKNKLKEVREYLNKNRKSVEAYFNPDITKILWEGDKITEKMQFFTTFYCYGKLEDYLIGRIDELENNNNMTKNSPWSSGLFYLLVAIFILATLGVLSKMVHWSILPLIIVGGLLIIGLIGFLQLRNDERLKEESFVRLVIETYKRLPIIGNLFKKEEKDK